MMKFILNFILRKKINDALITGEMRFEDYDTPRFTKNRNKRKALKFWKILKDRGHWQYKIFYNDWGYVVMRIQE